MASWSGSADLSTQAPLCRCSRRVEHAIQVGRVDPSNLLFSAHPALPADDETRVAVGEMEHMHTAADVFKGHPRYAAPGAAAEAIRSLLNGAQFHVLTTDGA